MKYRLRILRAWLANDLPPRCVKCRRYCFGAWASDMNAPIEQPVRRCWPNCGAR